MSTGPWCRPLQHRRKYGVPTILLQTKTGYHRLVISHKQYLILRGELGKALSTTYLLMRLLALGLPAQRTIKILGPAWCSRHDTMRKYRFSWPASLRVRVRKDYNDLAALSNNLIFRLEVGEWVIYFWID